MSDCIDRQAAITAIQKAYADTVRGMDKCAVWKNVGLTHALHIMQDLPSAQPEHLVEKSDNLVKGLVNDCISRRAAIDAAIEAVDEWDGGYNLSRADMIEKAINNLPSAQPEKMQLSEEDATKGTTFDCISRQAAIDAINKAFERVFAWDGTSPLGDKVLENVPSVQPERTETHSCDYERTETHGWIPVTERQPNHELAIVQYSDGDFDLLQFPTAYRWKDIVAWMPLPEPYKGEQDE